MASDRKSCLVDAGCSASPRRLQWLGRSRIGLENEQEPQEFCETQPVSLNGAVLKARCVTIGRLAGMAAESQDPMEKTANTFR